MGGTIPTSSSMFSTTEARTEKIPSDGSLLFDMRDEDESIGEMTYS